MKVNKKLGSLRNEENEISSNEINEVLEEEDEGQHDKSPKTRPQQQTTHITPRLRSSRIPRALSRLLPHNKPGVKERHTSLTRPTRGGEGRCRINKKNYRRQQHTTAIIVIIITATLTRGPAYS